MCLILIITLCFPAVEVTFVKITIENNKFLKSITWISNSIRSYNAF